MIMASEDRLTASSEMAETLGNVAKIVAAYLSKNQVSLGALPEVIRTVHNALLGQAGHAVAEPTPPQAPAVPIRKSITPDFIICLEDGRKLKMLKRHLRTMYNMTPDDYRAKWNLPPDYPMVAPNYASARSQFAKDAGLGRGRTGPRK
jgi:predicted transcriptional regulator